MKTVAELQLREICAFILILEDESLKPSPLLSTKIRR